MDKTMPRLFRSLIELHGLMTSIWRSDAATAKFLSTPSPDWNDKSPLQYMLEGGQPAIDKVIEWFRSVGAP